MSLPVPQCLARLPPRQRPSRAARRDALLEIAAREFAHGGWDQTSVDQIARAAGVSAPVLYDHFGSKRGLFLELLERHSASLLEHIASAVAAAKDPESRLRAHRGVLRVCRLRALRVAHRVSRPGNRPRDRRPPRRCPRKTTHLIATMFVAGGAPPERLGDVTIVAQLFNGGLNGLAAVGAPQT